MLCPECNRSFNAEAGSCPRCGAARGVVKTSTILISRGESRNVYRSVEEVPDPLKSQLIHSTNGSNSATIIIADRQGRKEIAKAIRHLPAPSGRRADQPEPTRRARRVALQTIGALILLAALALVWLLFRTV